MSKRWKMKQRGEIGHQEPPPVPALEIPDQREYLKAWEAQFTPYPREKLTPLQLESLEAMEREFPNTPIHIGTRDTRISGYFYSPELGANAFDFPNG